MGKFAMMGNWQNSQNFYALSAVQGNLRRGRKRSEIISLLPGKKEHSKGGGGKFREIFVQIPIFFEVPSIFSILLLIKGNFHFDSIPHS